jgi:ABC-type Fe3+-hydroxamate transport system substrate-binding protein
VAGGVPRSSLLTGTAQAATPGGGDLTFMQISDSHIGFANPPNADTPGTLRELYSVTEGSFLAELIAIAGGKVAGGATRLGYGKISQEALLTMNPDIVLDIMPASQSNAGPDPEAAWRELPELNAVRHGRVYVVREEFVPHASQMVARTAVLFARLLHPEVPPRDWEPR